MPEDFEIPDWGDIDVSDEHARIEEFDLEVARLRSQGLSDNQLFAMFRSLDPDAAVLEWHQELVDHGMTPEHAWEYIKDFGKVE